MRIIFYFSSNINNKVNFLVTPQVIRLLQLVLDYAVDFNMNEICMLKKRFDIMINTWLYLINICIII